jgi:hypothetical protein
LGRDLGEAVLAPWDPLARGSAPALDLASDRVALVRRLLDVGHGSRARRLAEAGPVWRNPAERQAALALLAAAGGEAELAGRLIDDALSRDPRSAEARALHLRLRRGRIVRGAAGDPRLLPLSELEAAVVEAWRLGGRGDWRRIEELEGALAAAGPGQPLYRQATRLRAAWRLAAGGRDRARAALRLIDPMLARGRTADDLWLRARAASAAGDVRGALASLSDLGRLIARHPRRETWARPALALLERLPQDPAAAEWRSSLRSLLATGG